MAHEHAHTHSHSHAGHSHDHHGGHSHSHARDSRALVIAMTAIAIATTGLMWGGPIALKNQRQYDAALIVLFMFLSFFIASLTEIFLYRQLGRLTTPREKSHLLSAPVAPMQTEFRVPQPRTLAEPIPIPSVTENTTRTLGYSHDERTR